MSQPQHHLEREARCKTATLLFSGERVEYIMNRTGDGGQATDSTRYEYLGDDTLVLHTYTPIRRGGDSLQHAFFGQKPTTDTLVGYPTHPRRTLLFDYDAYSLLCRFGYDWPYKYISTSSGLDSMTVDSIPVRYIDYKYRFKTWIFQKPEGIVSITRFGRLDGRIWFSFSDYGVADDDRLQFVMYTTINGRLVSDRFVTSRYIIDRAFEYDDMNRLKCVHTTRTELIRNNLVVRWTEEFKYDKF